MSGSASASSRTFSGKIPVSGSAICSCSAAGDNNSGPVETLTTGAVAVVNIASSISAATTPRTDSAASLSGIRRNTFSQRGHLSFMPGKAPSDEPSIPQCGQVIFCSMSRNTLSHCGHRTFPPGMEPDAVPTTPQWGQVIFISTSSSSIVHRMTRTKKTVLSLVVQKNQQIKHDLPNGANSRAIRQSALLLFFNLLNF